MQNTRAVVERLKGEGYEITEPYLVSLIRTDALPRPEKFGHQYAWSDADVERLRGILRRRGRAVLAAKT